MDRPPANLATEPSRRSGTATRRASIGSRPRSRWSTPARARHARSGEVERTCGCARACPPRSSRSMRGFARRARSSVGEHEWDASSRHHVPAGWARPLFLGKGRTRTASAAFVMLIAASTAIQAHAESIARGADDPMTAILDVRVDSAATRNIKRLRGIIESSVPDGLDDYAADMSAFGQSASRSGASLPRDRHASLEEASRGSCIPAHGFVRASIGQRDDDCERLAGRDHSARSRENEGSAARDMDTSALRQLFRRPQFHVRDGLDAYDQDIRDISAAFLPLPARRVRGESPRLSSD